MSRRKYETILVVLVFISLGKLIEASLQNVESFPTPLHTGRISDPRSHDGQMPNYWQRPPANKCSKLKCKNGCYNGKCI